MWIFAFGCLVGGCAGLLLAALFGMAHRGDVDQERIEAYYHGVKDGRVMGEIDLEDPEVG